jgi:Leucine-rich repeat (LRR) protein
MNTTTSVTILDREYNIENTTKYTRKCEGLDIFPDSICNLINLKDLILSENEFTTLPDSIGNLTRLVILKVSLNKLICLPDTIGNLSSLEILDLTCNKLITLPDSIGNLTKLKKIFLNNNKLTTFPDSIGNLVNLKTITLDDNKLSYLPKSILDIKNSLMIDTTGYQINNLSPDCEFLIFSYLFDSIDNLPFGIKEIWLKKSITVYKIKLPFGCEIKYY